MRYVALIRGINVGKENTFPMAELRELCESLGLKQVSTFIQSGNVIFDSTLGEAALAKKLQTALSKRHGRPVAVMLRTGKELHAILKKNPFKEQHGSRVGILFFAERVPKSFASEVTTRGGEEVALGMREVFINFPDGMGRTTLKLPKLALKGTMRNLNTVVKLCELAK